MTETDSSFPALSGAMRIAARNVAISRGGRRILAGVQLDAAPGEVVMLRGPNGAGKTSLLRAFAGLLPLEEGAIEYRNGGDNVPASSACTFCGVLNAVKPSLSVDENLAFWAALYNVPIKAARTARQYFRLDAFGDRPAGVLSTGLARRLGLARLMLADRPVWLVDEPTIALDSVAATIFFQLVAQHRSRGGIAIIAAHDALAINNVRTFELAQPVKAA